MFIARDDFAQVDGVDVAKKRCMELAMEASSLQGKAMEDVLSGLLGCNSSY